MPDFSDWYNSICTFKDESKSASSNWVINSNICTGGSKSSINESKQSQQIELLQNSSITQAATFRRKTVDLSMRQDVVNKSSLRKMKKFYQDVFKQHNLKLVRARFCNAKSSEVLRAIKRTSERYFDTKSLPVDFYHYLIGILKARDISWAKCSRQIKMEVFEFLDCSRNYSKMKFETLFKSQWLRILWRRFLSQNIEKEKYQMMQQEIEKYETKYLKTEKI